MRLVHQQTIFVLVQLLHNKSRIYTLRVYFLNFGLKFFDSYKLYVRKANVVIQSLQSRTSSISARDYKANPHFS